MTKNNKNRDLKTANDYAEGILHGDRIVLGRAITLAESRRIEHQALVREILEQCLPCTGNSLRIGISGSPGVGKSSFIETFGSYLTQEQGRRLAVLAIDPTSQVSRGSILGDKTRMSQLSTDPRAFIRPSPAGDSLGGVAARTREAMLLCEAAGFDTILIETVGVGQSETTVHGMVDFFLLLLLPGAGDELQGIKRGIVEMADLLAINKADGDRIELAKAARKEYAGALHLFPPKPSGWPAKTVTCSALTGRGIPEIWQLVLDFQQITKESGWFVNNRKDQAKQWLHELIAQLLKAQFYENEAVRAQLPEMEDAVVENKLPIAKAADRLIDLFKKSGQAAI
ncbi:MAG: methylmalonyl Co-A mutase-associated GTPase MeaB [Saprospiraceae bacterium]